MSQFTLEVFQAALDDVENASTYYDEQSDGLGFRFEQEFWNTVEGIEARPRIYPPKTNAYREALMKTFPYLVIFRMADSTIQIVQVFHTSRNPKKKFKKRR